MFRCRWLRWGTKGVWSYIMSECDLRTITFFPRLEQLTMNTTTISALSDATYTPADDVVVRNDRAPLENITQPLLLTVSRTELLF